jgi:hypothetical protein
MQDFVCKPEGKTPLVSPRHREDYNTENDCKYIEWEGVGQTNLTQRRNRGACCENGDENSHNIKYGEFDQLKKYCASWN